MNSVLFRISSRNLLEHRAKTIILGILISLGVLVLIVGNSIMDTATLGIKKAFIDNYTGHVMITGIARGDISIFGVQSPGRMESTPIVPDYRSVLEYLEGNPEVDKITAQATTFGVLGMEEIEVRVFTLLFGIEPESYHAMFDNITILDGGYLKPGEEGILVSRQRLDELEKELSKTLTRQKEEEVVIKYKVGDPVRIISFGNMGYKIREVPIRGIFEFKNISEGVGANMISYVDIQTLRSLLGLSLSFEGEIDLDEGETALLSIEDEGDLFSSDSFTVEETESSEFTREKLEGILGEKSEAVESPGEGASAADAAAVYTGIETGSWQYILLTLKHPRNLGRFITSLNLWFKTQGIPARAGDWEAAAGPFATTADVLRTVFNIAILIVGIVALIIMMNTLVLSVIERTSEIGTMRALGARKGFVWRMFLLETLIIVFVFWIAGVALSGLTILILNLLALPATNPFLQILFAGEALKPQLSVLSVFSSALIVMVLGIIAHTYPVSMALKIQPIRAIQVE